jgi:integrase
MFKKQTPATLREYLAEYAMTRVMGKESVRQYEITIDLFERWRGAPVQLASLGLSPNEVEISAWLRDYAASGKSPSTVRSKRGMLLTLWRNAADDGYADPPKRRVRTAPVVLPPPVAWAHGEVVSLVRACRALKRKHKCGLPRKLWWELAVRVAWDTSLRLGDLLKLRARDIGRDGIVTVIQSKTRRPIVCRLSPETMLVFDEAMRLCPRDLVCPWPTSRETFNKQVRLLVQKAGIRAGTWKWLRRGGGTDVEVQLPGGAPRQLGHGPGSRVAYAHYVDDSIVAAERSRLGNAVWPRALPSMN